MLVIDIAAIGSMELRYSQKIGEVVKYKKAAKMEIDMGREWAGHWV